jgi:S1-C subfamily serine protease
MNNFLRVLMYGLMVAAGIFFGMAIRSEYNRIMAKDTKLGSVIRLVEPQGGTFCSAVVISDTLAVTANHCVNNEIEVAPGLFGVQTTPSMEIRATDNLPRGLSAAPVWWDFRRDIAIIKGDFKTFAPRKFLSRPEDLQKQMKKGTKFISCGYPYHGSLYCSNGIYVERFGFHWEISNLVLPGMSGGPTMLEDGTVVGINDAVEGSLSVISPTYNLPVEK